MLVEDGLAGLAPDPPAHRSSEQPTLLPGEEKIAGPEAVLLDQISQDRDKGGMRRDGPGVTDGSPLEVTGLMYFSSSVSYGRPRARRCGSAALPTRSPAASRHRPAGRGLPPDAGQTFRASTTEAADAKGISKARFIAQAVHAELHGRPRLDQDEALDRLEAARIQLVRAGTNLNQIAKVLNSGGDALHIARAADAVADAATTVRAAARKLVS